MDPEWDAVPDSRPAIALARDRGWPPILGENYLGKENPTLRILSSGGAQAEAFCHHKLKKTLVIWPGAIEHLTPSLTLRVK